MQKTSNKQKIDKTQAKKEKTDAIIQKIKEAKGLKKFWLFIVFGALLLLGGGALQANPPKWFLTPKSASDTVYGLGTGDSLAQAKMQATNDLAQSIQTQVKSSTNITNSAFNDRFDSSVEQNISLSTAMLDLQNLKITQKSHKKGKYYVEVSIAKKDVAMPIKARLEQGLARLESLPKTCASLSLKDFSTLQKELKNARESSAILRSLGFASLDFDDFNALLQENAPKPKLKVELDTVPQSDRAIFLGEVAKFARITQEANIHILSIESSLINEGKNTTIEVKAVMKDCANNVLWESSFNETQSSRNQAIKRASIVLYKRLLDFSGGTQGGIPKI